MQTDFLTSVEVQTDSVTITTGDDCLGGWLIMTHMQLNGLQLNGLQMNELQLNAL